MLDANDDGVLGEIARRREELSSAEGNVADLVLTVPELPLTMSMRALARRAGVSDATVLRFCRILGFKGYSDFKLAIARYSGPASKPLRTSSTAAHSPERAIQRVKEVLSRVEEIAGAESFRHVKTAASRIADADMVYIFAFGASSVAAWDFMHRLHYLGIKAAVLSDPHLQALRIERMTKKSVALFLSIGYSRLLSEMAEGATERGVFSVAVATPGTPLTAVCNASIFMTKDAGGSFGPPVLGRYLQLVILDTIAEEIGTVLGTEHHPSDDIEGGMHFNY